MAISDTEDQELIRAIAEDRSKVAMEQLYVRYRTKVAGFLRRLTQDQSLIEEVYNDVMWKVWEKADQFKGESKVSSWIFTIAYRDCLRLIRKQRMKHMLYDTFGNYEEQEEFDSHIGYLPDIENHELIQKALATLPAKQRIAVELCYHQGYSTEEIGHIADCPTNTVKTRLFHARQKLRAYIEKHDTTIPSYGA